MGWWETGENDDIIGDGPADIVVEILIAIASDFEEQGKPKPSLQQCLDAIFLVLCEQREDIENGEEVLNRSLVAELEPMNVKIWSQENSSVGREY